MKRFRAPNRHRASSMCVNFSEGIARLIITWKLSHVIFSQYLRGLPLCFSTPRLGHGFVPGDVAMLVARIVGRSGEVVAIERDPVRSVGPGLALPRQVFITLTLCIPISLSTRRTHRLMRPSAASFRSLFLLLWLRCVLWLNKYDPPASLRFKRCRGLHVSHFRRTCRSGPQPFRSSTRPVSIPA
jgi:hypothetical protein